MKLYYHPLSGHSHRARLLLSLLDVRHELVLVDLAVKAQKQTDFLALNPFGQLPVLDDDGMIIADSNAIMVYVAKKMGRADWLPETPAGAAAVQRWLSVAAGQIAHGPAMARMINVFKAPYRREEVLPRAHAILTLIEAALDGRDWIATDRTTIADVALYSYVARAPEGDINLAPYPHIRLWLARVEALPGFVEFQKTPVGIVA